MRHRQRTLFGEDGDLESVSLETLLEEYLLQAEAGVRVDVEQLLSRNPSCREELMEFAAIDRQLRGGSDADGDLWTRTTMAGEISDIARNPPSFELHLAEPPAQTHVIGDYELLEEIDRGGMGIVFRARHKVLRRTVAIKMLLAGSFATEEAERRFRREAAAAARLDHPGIVSVFEVGTTSASDSLPGQIWFAMAFVEGTNLAHRIDQNLFDGKAAARLGIQMADAVHYAHQKGVIHRDLKPANILLDKDGCPRITDFGLSRCVEDGETQLTNTGQVFGTPTYMSPEQALGRNQDVGTASDIYSLGAILYCMVTGRPPFRANSTVRTLQQVIHDVPVPPRLLNREIPADLESIILKCLEKRPQDRYTDAEALKHDLEHFQAGEAVTAASANLVGFLGRVLASSRNSEFLEGWSRTLYLLAAVVLGSHVLLQFASLSTALATAVNGLKYFTLLAIVWHSRSGVLTPQNPVERTIWNLWIGYGLASVTTELRTRLRTSETAEIHEIMSLVSSVILMVLGGQLWGGCYVLGGLFLVLAAAVSVCAPYSTILYGGLWAATFALLGRQYRRRAEAASTKDQ